MNTIVNCTIDSQWKSCISLDSDIPYEEDLLKNPYNLNGWLRYIDTKHATSHPVAKALLFERAILELPGSYKLWRGYIQMCYSIAESNGTMNHRNCLLISDLYERCLLYLHKMPKIWIEYIQLLLKQGYITRTRKVLDRALQSLPISQHDDIWDLYLDLARFIQDNCNSERLCKLALDIHARYTQFNPNHILSILEELMQLSIVNHYIDCQQAILFILLKLLLSRNDNENRFKEFINLISNHSGTITEYAISFARTINAPKEAYLILSSMSEAESFILKHRNDGWTWCSISTWFIRTGNYIRARCLFSRALKSINTARDFGQVFDAYATFEENIAKEFMQNNTSLLETDMQLARLELLMKQRSLLLSDVLLRNDKNNASEWISRAHIYKDNPVHIFITAVKTIDPNQVTGKSSLADLWLEFANYYIEKNDNQSVESIFEKAIQVPFAHVNELVDVWMAYSSWIERTMGIQGAIESLIRATKLQTKDHINYFDDHLSPQIRMVKSIKLWSRIIELEKLVPDNMTRIRAAYDRTIELRIATPNLIFSYADYVESVGNQEDAFRIYEHGIELFGYPPAFDFWNVYLVKFINYYGGSKLERTRSLFERALEDIPPKYAKSICITYGLFEEKNGLASNSMKIYERATSYVDIEEKKEMYLFYISKSIQYFGLISTRPIFEDAIRILSPNDAKDMCIKYSELERKLGEVERARSIFSYGSKFCDPRTVPDYWSTWQEFEIKHGNEETFREMLRIKRTVQSRFPDKVIFTSSSTDAK